MTETLDTASAIQSILFRIEGIEGTQHLLLQAQSDDVLAKILPVFEKSKNANLGSVYLRIDGKSIQADIVRKLKADGIKISQPVVSERMTTLEDHGLIEPVTDGKRAGVFQKKRVVEKVLRLSTRLRELGYK